MIYIIGSGHAAIGLATALIERTRDICILDVGYRLEEDRHKAKLHLARMSPGDWRFDDLAFLREGSAPTTKGLPKKQVYGSEFVYNEPASATGIDALESKVMRSFALGGLSNVWGACSLPYPEAELQDWPRAACELAPHYAAIKKVMPIAAEADDLETLLPLYGDGYGVPHISKQGQALRSDLMRKRDRLLSRKIYFGAARTAYRNDRDQCRRCGYCLYGCPYDLIYSSALGLPELVEKGVTYQSGMLVRKVAERNGRSIISAISCEDGKEKTFEGDRVFIAAGVWGTAELVLRSLEAYDMDLTMKHSDRFMLPILRLAGTRGVAEEEMTTLSQLFVEIDDRKLAPQSVHLQVYTYNDMMKAALVRRLGPLNSILKWPLEQFLSRLLILFGYIHSDSSQHMQVRLIRSHSAERLIVRGVANPQSGQIARRTARILLREIAAFRSIPAWPIMDPPGGGNHTGGSFPMRDNPSGFETDIWGRLSGWERTHIVDASCFPSLPAATVAFPSMANAHRIGAGCEL